MQDFVGCYEHNLDAKNRLFVPAKFRDALTGHFVIKAIPSEFPCIQCYSTEEFRETVKSELAGVTNALSRRIREFGCYAGSAEVTVDAQGRIAIPQAIAEKAKITKETIVAGMGDRVEIWDPAIFKAFSAFVDEDYMEREAADRKEEKIALERKASGAYLPQAD